MAKIRKTKLSWIPSHSDQAIAYKLYWSKEDNVGYDSNFIELGNVMEVHFPDIIKYLPTRRISLWFGITAVDVEGNESDITHLPGSYNLETPAAPTNVLLKDLDEYEVIEETMGTMGSNLEL